MNSIKKSAGPEFRQQARPVRNCPECRGKGVVMGVFYEMTCMNCERSRMVDSSTGEKLPYEELALLLWAQLDRAKEQIGHQQRTINDIYSDVGHGPMGKRYHGD